MLFLLVPDLASAAILSTQDWWGTIGFTHQRRMLDGDTTGIKSQLTGDINGKYYLWQPWFLTGNLRLTLSTDTTDSGGQTRDSTAIGGNFSANVLPLSRYPFSMTYRKSDNTINDSSNFVNSSGQFIDLGDSYTTTSYSITQKYLGKHLQLSASFLSDENESDHSGRFSGTTKKFGLVHRVPHNDTNLTVQQREDQLSNSDEERDNQMAVLTHNFYPSQDFNVSNFASKVDQLDHIDLNDDGIVDEYRHEIDQFSSTATWRSEDKKTHINGNLRYTGILTEQQASYENLSTNVGLGMRYRFTKNINARASTSYTETELNGTPGEQSSYATSLDYSSDSIDLAEFNYNWGSSLGHTQQDTDSSSETTSTVSLNHNASRNWRHGRKGRIRFSVNQGVNHQTLSTQDDKQTLNHTLLLGYTRGGNGGTQYAQASYSENRNISGTDELTQQLHLQYSRQHKLSMRASLNGSLTHQQNTYQSATQDTRSDSSSALLNYSLRHNFSFQSLHFNSIFKYSMLHSNIAEDSNRYTWDNVLKHQIGQLSSSLTIRIQEAQNQQTSLILLNVKRRF